jgi:hypothetical protein
VILRRQSDALRFVIYFIVATCLSNRFSLELPMLIERYVVGGQPHSWTENPVAQARIAASRCGRIPICIRKDGEESAELYA